MYKKTSVQVVHVMLMISTIWAFGTVSTEAADIEDLRRTIKAAEQELDNTLSTAKSIEDLLVRTEASLLSRNADSTRATISSSQLLIILAFVNGLQTKLDGLSKDTDRIANVLASISVEVEETGNANLIDAYSNVKRQVLVVYDAILQAQILANDITNLIRRMMASKYSDPTYIYGPTTS